LYKNKTWTSFFFTIMFFYIFIMLFFCWLCSSCVVFFLDASCWCCFPHVLLFFAWWCSCSSLCFFVVLFVCCYYSLSISVAILLVMVLSFPHVGTWYIPFFALLYCFLCVVALFFSHCHVILLTLLHCSFHTCATSLLFLYYYVALLMVPHCSACATLLLFLCCFVFFTFLHWSFFSHSYATLITLPCFFPTIALFFLCCPCCFSCVVALFSLCYITALLALLLLSH